MEKIALDVLHEVELYSNSDLDHFTAQLFLITKDKLQFAFDLNREKKNENIFTFKIPKSLKSFLKDTLKYKVYVYLDNARFLADDGDIQVISQDDFTGGKITNPVKDVKFSAKIKGDEDKPEKEQPKEEKPKPKKEEKPKEEKPKTTKKDDKPKKSLKEVLGPATTPEPTKKEKINLDEIFDQHRKIKEALDSDETGTKKTGRSLRDYAERVERHKKLSENKEELNDKVKKILSDFQAK